MYSGCVGSVPVFLPHVPITSKVQEHWNGGDSRTTIVDIDVYFEPGYCDGGLVRYCDNGISWNYFYGTDGKGDPTCQPKNLVSVMYTKDYQICLARASVTCLRNMRAPQIEMSPSGQVLRMLQYTSPTCAVDAQFVQGYYLTTGVCLENLNARVHCWSPTKAWIEEYNPGTNCTGPTISAMNVSTTTCQKDIYVVFSGVTYLKMIDCGPPPVGGFNPNEKVFFSPTRIPTFTPSTSPSRFPTQSPTKLIKGTKTICVEGVLENSRINGEYSLNPAKTYHGASIFESDSGWKIVWNPPQNNRTTGAWSVIGNDTVEKAWWKASGVESTRPVFDFHNVENIMYFPQLGSVNTLLTMLNQSCSPAKSLCIQRCSVAHCDGTYTLRTKPSSHNIVYERTFNKTRYIVKENDQWILIRDITKPTSTATNWFYKWDFYSFSDIKPAVKVGIRKNPYMKDIATSSLDSLPEFTCTNSLTVYFVQSLEERVSNLSIMLLCVFGGGALLMAFIGYIDAKRRRIQNYRPTAIIFWSLNCLDFFTDVLLVITLIYADITSPLTIAAITFVVIPFVVNLYQIGYFVHFFNNDETTSSAYIHKYYRFLGFASIFSGSIFSALSLLNSHWMTMPAFSINFSDHHINDFHEQRFLSIVILENIPQLVIQIILVAKQQTSIVAIMALVSSSLSVMTAVLNFCSNRIRNSMTYQDGFYLFSIKSSRITKDVFKKLRSATRDFSQIIVDSKFCGPTQSSAVNVYDIYMNDGAVWFRAYCYQVTKSNYFEDQENQKKLATAFFLKFSKFLDGSGKELTELKKAINEEDPSPIRRAHSLQTEDDFDSSVIVKRMLYTKPQFLWFQNKDDVNGIIHDDVQHTEHISLQETKRSLSSGISDNGLEEPLGV